MLLQYKRKANIAAGIWLASMVPLIFVIIADGDRGVIREILQPLLIFVNVGSFWYAFWAFAKAKGYSGFLGLVLPIFSILGLIILVSLRDKHKEGEPTALSPRD